MRGKSMECEVMVTSAGGEFNSFHKPTPVSFRVPGVLTGAVERYAPEAEGREGVIKSAQVRFSNGTVFIPAASILEPSPYGGLFPIEEVLARCVCGHLPESHIECVDFTAATGCGKCECAKYQET